MNPEVTCLTQAQPLLSVSNGYGPIAAESRLCSAEISGHPELARLEGKLATRVSNKINKRIHQFGSISIYFIIGIIAEFRFKLIDDGVRIYICNREVSHLFGFLG